jgi:predicted nuclease of predicted toxin-antitoxin system
VRLLVDQDVYAPTIAALVAGGHDVVRAAERGMAGAPDSAILAAARTEGRVLVTRDLDFGRLVQLGPSAPVVILRFPPSALSAMHEELLRVLAHHTADELAGAVVIVEPARHRIRRLALPDE